MAFLLEEGGAVGWEKIIGSLLAGVGFIALPSCLVAWIITQAFPKMQLAEQRRWEEREKAVAEERKEREGAVEVRLDRIQQSNERVVAQVVATHERTVVLMQTGQKEVVALMGAGHKNVIEQIMHAHAQREALRDEAIKSLTSAVRGFYDIVLPTVISEEPAPGAKIRAGARQILGERNRD